MGNYINYKGQVLPADQPVLKAGNRNLQYGDGLFETMRIANGNILLGSYHFERLMAGCHFMNFKMPAELDEAYLTTAILDLCKKNGHPDAARVRLTLFRNMPDVPDEVFDQPAFIIESWKLDKTYTFNESAFKVGVYEGALKSIDAISGSKTTGFLSYALAGVAARQNGYDDCLVLNTDGHVCDSSIANVFWVKDGVIHTPPPGEGCILGVMRRHLVNSMEEAGFRIEQVPLTVHMLSMADEVFLTNVIKGIQPVTEIPHVSYTIDLSRKLFDLLIAPLTNP